MKRKLCRAAACPRHVGQDELFCQVHFRQFPPAIAAPISDNREAPGGAARDAFLRIKTGTSKAVAFIAKKEGRASALADAVRTQAFDPGQGGTGNASTTAEATSSSRTIRETDRYDLQ